MKVIDPHEIGSLNYTDVTVNSEDDYASGTTYAAGDLVKYPDSGTADYATHVYRSLRDSNTGNTPPDNLEPEVLSAYSNTSFAVAVNSQSFTLTEDVSFVAGQVVLLEKRNAPNTVNCTGEVVSYTSGTKALYISVYSITGSGTHTNWKITSVDEVGIWELVEATNLYKMFDSYTNTKTVEEDSITIKVDVSRADTVALFGLVGTDVTAALWDSTGAATKYWEDSADLVYGAAIVENITDWWEYFFGEYTALEEVVLISDDGTYDGLMVITINATTGTDAECGQVIIGRGMEIGTARYGARLGILDYSVKSTDSDGYISITEGAWAKTVEYNVLVSNTAIDAVIRRLVSLRATPTAWIGRDSGFESFIVYGIFRDFDMVVEGPNHSICTLEIEGLI